MLITLKQKRYIASDNVVFFRPLFLMAGRAANKIPALAREYACRLLPVINARPPAFRDGQLPDKEQMTMSTQSKVTSTRRTRKTKSVSVTPNVVANIIQIPLERRQEVARNKWSQALKIYISMLNENDFDIAQHVIRFIAQKPRIVDPYYSCLVIPFPVSRTCQSKSLEA